jgi:hypothetical protein
MGDAQGQAEQAVQNAAPHEVEAHRGFLSEALDALQQSGKDPNQVTQQAGAGNTDPQSMTPAQLASTTLQLARQHPDIVKAIGEKYPIAQPLLATIVGSEMGQAQQAGAPQSTLQELAGFLTR